jgi:hypothetical protein
MMEMTTKFTLYIDGWLSEEGFHIFVDDKEEILTFFKMANDFIESQCVPSIPPTIRQDGREAIAKLAYELEATAAYLRKQADAIRDWENKDRMGYRD